MKYIYIVQVLVFFLMIIWNTESVLDPSEKAALISLYDAFGQPVQLTNWNASDQNDPCTNQWYGIGCDSASTHVTSVNLDGGGEGWIPLRGNPAALSQLSQLTLLSIKHNAINASIPSLCLDWDNSPLMYVDLSYNQFYGGLMSFSDCTKLKYLILEHNGIGYGSQAVGFNDLDLLRTCSLLFQVKLSYNVLIGGVGSFFSNSLGVYQVELAHNKLKGDLVYIQNPPNMYYLDISYNQFSGTLDTYGGLQFSGLHTFLASHNMDPETGVKLHGSLSFIYKSNRLAEIDISGNAFSDDIQIQNLTTLPNFEYLGYIQATENLLTGFLPDGYTPSRFLGLSLAGNPFWCPIGSYYSTQQIGATCTNVTLKTAVPQYSEGNSTVVSLDSGSIAGNSIECMYSATSVQGKDIVLYKQGSVISSSSLECAIPAASEMIGLDAVYSGEITIISTERKTIPIAINKLGFYGELPSKSEMNAIKDMYKSWNQPSGLSSWTMDPPHALPCKDWTGLSCESWDGHVTSLELWGQKLMEGGLPFALSELKWLKTLQLETSQMHGELNASIFTTLVNLEKLSLSSNTYLSGPIPKTIGLLSHLEYLNLGGNRFEGDIPSNTLSNLKFLKTLDARFNSLTGHVEPLSSLHNVEEIILDMNMLHGSILPILQNCTKLKTLHCSQNKMTGFLPSTLNQIDFAAHGNPFWCPIPPALAGKAECTVVSLLEIRSPTVDSSNYKGNLTISVSSGAVDVSYGLLCMYTNVAGHSTYTPAIAVSPHHIECDMPTLSAPYWRVQVSIAWSDESDPDTTPRIVSNSPALYFEAFPCYPNNCFGPMHGNCLGMGLCECVGPWTGSDCSIECSNHGVSVQIGCRCKRPWFGNVCEIPEVQSLSMLMHIVALLVSLVSITIALLWIWSVWRKKTKGQSVWETWRNDVEKLERASIREIRMTRSNLQIIFLLLVETVQLSSFQVSPDVPWWESAKLSEIMPAFLLYIPSIYSGLFWGSVGIVVLWVIMWTNMMTEGKWLKTHRLSKLDSYVLPLIGNALFLPLVTIFIRAFICWYPEHTLSPFLVADESMQCWVGIHWAYITVGFIALLVFVPTALRSQRIWMERELVRHEDPQISFSPAFLELLIVTKYMQAAVFIVFAGKVMVSIGASTVLLTLMLVFMTQHRCSNVPSVANYRMFSYSVALWSCLSATVAVFTNDTSHFATIMLLSGICVLGGLYVWRHSNLSKKVVHSDAQGFDNDKSISIDTTSSSSMVEIGELIEEERREKFIQSEMVPKNDKGKKLVDTSQSGVFVTSLQFGLTEDAGKDRSVPLLQGKDTE